MARKCTQPKRLRNAAWYKEKAMLAKAQEAGQILDDEQLRAMVLTLSQSREKMIDSQMDDMIKEKLALKEQVDALEQNLSKQIKEKECQSAHTVHMLTKRQGFYDNIHKQAIGYQNPFYLKKAQRIKPTLYDGVVISNKHVAMHVIDNEETLILEEDFEKHFVPQQELSADEVVWYHMFNHSTKSSVALPVKTEAPKELLKVSLMNESLKELKLHLANFEKLVKIRTTPNARTEGEWGFEHTKPVFNNEIIPFLKSLKYIFNVFDRDLLNEIMKVQTVFDQIDAVVQQSTVDKQCLEISKIELLLEINQLLHHIMSQDVCLTVMNSMSLIDESVNVERKQKESCNKCFNLEAELLKSQNTHNDILKRIKGKDIIDIDVQKPSSNTIVLGMFKLDLESLAPRLLQNREIHLEYLKNTHKQADILRGIVKQAKEK
nr:hypothetical protein [Tanacetum cinerariifolium]